MRGMAAEVEERKGQRRVCEGTSLRTDEKIQAAPSERRPKLRSWKKEDQSREGRMLR
jgi:hypothetical protein